MNIIARQIYWEQDYRCKATMFKGQVQNNCKPSDLYDVYHQIIRDLYQCQQFLEKAKQYYLIDQLNAQIKKYEKLRKEILWDKVYTIRYGNIYDEIYQFWRRVKLNVKSMEQSEKERRKKEREREEQQSLQRLQQAMNRLSLSNWKCYNNHKCVLQSGKQKNLCNICRQRIENKLLLRCNACDFDICGECADNQDPSIVQKFYPPTINSTKPNNNTVNVKPNTQKTQTIPSNNGWVCVKNHKLSQISDKNHYYCSICWQKIGAKTSLRCPQCDFDVCNTCWTTKGPKIVKIYDNFFNPEECEKGHKMHPIHTSKHHSCNICRGDIIFQPFLTCVPCDYDVCQSCNKDQESDEEQIQENYKPTNKNYNQASGNKTKPIICPQGHKTIFYSNGGVYPNGKFVCNQCQQPKGRVKTYHCPSCSWDICDECIDFY